MILISVKSNFMDVKRQFETDKAADIYLHTVKKLHDTQRKYLLSRFTSKYKPGTVGCVAEREGFYKNCLPLKVEIINTDNAQLNLKTQLK